MPIHYLHLAAFTCETCNGPVLSGSFATRKTETQRESDIREVGSVCLSFRKQFSELPTSRAHTPRGALEWDAQEPTPKRQVSLREPGSVMKDYIQ